MRLRKLLVVGGSALAMTLAACGAEHPPSQVGASGGPAAGASTSAPHEGSATTEGSAATDLCAALDKLGKSIRAADDSDSMAEFRAKFAAIQQDYEAVQVADGGQHSVQAGDLGRALANAQDGSETSPAEAAAELARGYDRLAAAVDCA